TPIYVGEDRMGEVTSGVIGPLLEVGIALAFVRADVKVGTPVEAEIRGARLPAMLVTKRFLKTAKTG
ncbi:MAG: hypothetical protein C4320_08430, partial [Armatimonadota bacterium]